MNIRKSGIRAPGLFLEERRRATGERIERKVRAGAVAEGVEGMGETADGAAQRAV